jgi:hypothetical protein
MIPREFVPLINTFTRDPQESIELWSYAIILLMIDEEQVRMVGTRYVAERQWVTLQIYGGEEFDILLPDLTEQEERRLLDGVREIVEFSRSRKRHAKKI